MELMKHVFWSGAPGNLFFLPPKAKKRRMCKNPKAPLLCTRQTPLVALSYWGG